MKTKTLVIILTCVFIASLTGFVITTAVTGVNLDRGFMIGWSHGTQFISTPHDASKVFNESFTDIEIGAISSRVTIKVSGDDKTRVQYKGDNPNVEFFAEVRGNTLVVRERTVPNSFRWWGWNWGWGSWSQSTLDIELPEEVYNKIKINLTSGRVTGELPHTDNLDLNVTSGSINLEYKHDNTARHLRSHTTSGSVTLNGFKPETYDIYSTSGTQRITGLAGSGTIRMTSGTINADFAEWNGSLEVRITSGNANITVPSGSGADLNFTRTSGSMKYDMDGDSGRLSSSARLKFGGDNKQNVTINITSGNASIKTR